MSKFCWWNWRQRPDCSSSLPSVWWLLLYICLHHVPKVVGFCAAARVCHETWFTVGCVSGCTLHADKVCFSQAFITIHERPLRVAVVLNPMHCDMIYLLTAIG
jgi:hypothetical protein